MQAPADQRPGVFICYRREDTPAHAGRLYDRLVDRFGAARVFMDVDSIGLGVDWIEALRRAVESCEVMLVLIGPGWEASAKSDGARRLDDPDDYVRLEVETALDRGIRVVPLLVHGATLPAATALPDSLRRLTRRQALEIGDATFRTDAGLLIERLEVALGGRDAQGGGHDGGAAGAATDRRSAGESAPGPPATLTVKTPAWSARAENAGSSRRRLVVTLARSVHTIEYRLRMLLPNELRVDGEVTGSRSLLDAIRAEDTQLERYEFSIGDGDRRRQAILQVNLSATAIEGLELWVEGRLLHRGQ